jgi:predicted RNase H-like nuclease (RuvC/YqgF family)
MSSCILSSRNNNNKSNQQDYNEVEEILNQGIEKIYHSFSINNKIYKEKITEDENIINSLTKKLEMLKNEIEMIQRENQYYKSQNEKLKKEVEKLNKIVNNIRGKLTSVDLQINECIKNDNIKTNLKKNFDTNQKKKNSLYINFSNRDGSESFFRLNTKKFLDEEKNGNYNNKSIKNKKLLYYMDNSNNTKDNGNKLDNVKENINNTA